MKGYIDMIFFFNGRYYLVDWKSNCLGLHITDYGKSALINEIKENHYEIQYLIYVLALHKYLAKRICDYSYEKNFGGVFYLFIRGISSQYGPEYGVFYDLPEPNSIYELEEVLYD
jgi:exodeoxyribonuclease V beta subunit